MYGDVGQHIFDSSKIFEFRRRYDQLIYIV